MPHDQLRYAIIKSAECITGRHLLEQTVGAVAKAVNWEGNVGRCENVAQLVVELGRMLEGWRTSDDGATNRKIVLVFDGIDHQREAPPTLLPGLARLGEIVSPFLCQAIFPDSSDRNTLRYLTSQPSTSSQPPDPTSCTSLVSPTSTSPPTPSPNFSKLSHLLHQLPNSQAAQRKHKKPGPASPPQSTTLYPSTQAATSSPSAPSACVSGRAS